MARLSVRFHEVVIEAGHVEVAARGPFAGGGVPDVGADEHERADVLHAPTPGALVPHTVHEHIRPLALQWAFAPRIDLGVHFPEPVAQCLGGYAVAPQKLADVVHAAGGDAGQVHVDQRLLDALFPAAVSFDDRRLEDRALQFRHLQFELADLGRQPAFVVTGAKRLPTGLALVSAGVGDLVGLGFEHRIDDLLDPGLDQGIEPGLEHGVVELYDFLGHGLAPLSNRGFLVQRLKIVHGTGHVLFQEARITKCARFRALSDVEVAPCDLLSEF